MRPARSHSIAAVFAVSALTFGTVPVMVHAQAPAPHGPGAQQGQSPPAGQPQVSQPQQSKSAVSNTPAPPGAAANSKDAWHEKWVKEYWAKEEERQRKLKEAKASSNPANNGARTSAGQRPAGSGNGAVQSSGGRPLESPKNASAQPPVQAPPQAAAQKAAMSNPAGAPVNNPAVPKPASTVAALTNTVTHPANGASAAQPAPAKATELAGSQTKPDILTGPDIGKDHTLESPLQVVGEGWKMVAYLMPTLAFILVCLHLVRRYQQKTGKLPAGLTSGGRDFGRPSPGIGSAFAGLLNFARTSMSKPEPAQGIRILESLTVGPGSLHLVQVRGRVLLLSAGAAGMTVLTEFKQESGAESDEFRSLLHSAAADMEALDMPGHEMPVSAVVGSLEDGVRETAEAMARRLRRLRAAGENQTTVNSNTMKSSYQPTHPLTLSPSHSLTPRCAMQSVTGRPRAILVGLLRNKMLWVGVIGLLLSGWLTGLQASAQNLAIPKVTLGIDPSKNPQDVAVSLQILFLMTILTIAPSLLIMMTAFTRIIIVFSILRSALGTPQIPPNQILAGMALFLTFFIMQPTFTKINDDALTPYFANKITMPVMLDRAEKPLHSFMLRQTYKSDLIFFINLSKVQRPRTENDVQLLTLIPAFITSELKTAFIIGFYIYLPFLIIDMVVASTLMSMGMMMLPPTVISLPAKLMLFVLANGWTLLIGALARGFR